MQKPGRVWRHILNFICVDDVYHSLEVPFLADELCSELGDFFSLGVELRVHIGVRNRC